MILENVSQIKEEIEAAAKKAGRHDKILLIAATKTRTPDQIQEAIRAGIDATAENRIQEFTDKFPQGAYIGKPMHFIGHLQTNKLKYIVGKVDLIESVDSLHLANEMNKICLRENIRQDVLLEINIGAEENKHGFSPDEFSSVLPQIAKLDGIYVRGLMTVAPILDESGKVCKLMERMKRIFVDTSNQKYDNISMEYLSMGMSGDFREAIECGANIVRIGSAIFGPRDYTQAK